VGKSFFKVLVSLKVLVKMKRAFSAITRNSLVGAGGHYAIILRIGEGCRRKKFSEFTVVGGGAAIIG
jgi:hypothetical protein